MQHIWIVYSGRGWADLCIEKHVLADRQAQTVLWRRQTKSEESGVVGQHDLLLQLERQLFLGVECELGVAPAPHPQLALIIHLLCQLRPCVSMRATLWQQCNADSGWKLTLQRLAKVTSILTSIRSSGAMHYDTIKTWGGGAMVGKVHMH